MREKWSVYELTRTMRKVENMDEHGMDGRKSVRQ